MNSFEHFVKEFLVENEEFKTIKDKYGKILFGDIRDLKERDTEYEYEQFEDLREFIGSSHGVSLNANIIQTFKELLKLKKKFPKVLEPPKYKEVYRGFVAWASRGDKHKEITSLINKALENPDKFIERDSLVIGPKKEYHFYKLAKNLKYTYKPHSEIQSWTTSSDSAAAFTNISLDMRRKEVNINMLSCIIAAVPARNEMLFNDKFVNLVYTDGTSEDRGEFEVIRISKRPIKCDVYISGPYMEEMLRLKEKE